MFGSRLRKLRESKEMSQIELGKALGIGNVTLSQYEKGSRKPDNETLIKIANYFRVSTDYLLGIDDNLRKEIAEADARLAKEKQELLELISILDENDMEKIVDYFKLLIAAKGK